MKLFSSVQSILLKTKEHPVLAGGLTLGALAVALLLMSGSSSPTQGSSFYAVKRGDFLISIVEGGTIEAVREHVIRSEVEGTARIIYIVPEGSYVKEGDLLVELDSLASQDAVNQQQINVEKAQFALIQAEQQLEIQKSLVDSETDAAKLKVEFAESDLNKYQKGEQAQLLRNAQIDITNVVESLQIAIERLEWTERLFAKGYETKANLDKDRLTVSQSTLKQEQAQKALWMLEQFDIPKKKRELEAALQEARENLDRVKLQGERKLEQFKADVETQKSTLELSRRKLERDQKQLEATKIYAPQGGLVVYAGGGGGRFSSESMIEEGAVIRNRQEIIKLPDISEMKLSVKIHESHINQVRKGQPAYVVLDAMPDQRFRGEVNRVAPLPDSMARWGNPNLKVYATEILVTDPLPDVKPGVSARAEIIITNLPNVLTVPIQAVTTRKGKQVVFLASAPQQPVLVSLGMFNIKQIEVTSGLNEGDQVLLSPPFDTEERDLAGSIITEGDALPTASTNRPVESTRRRDFNGNGDPEIVRVGAEAGPSRELEGIRGQGVGADAEQRPGREERRREFGPGGPRLSGGREGEREGGRGFGRPGEGGRGGEANRGPRFNQEEILKQFDRNGDGQLDETERAAIRERFGRDRRRGEGTNALPETSRPRPDANR